MGTFAYACPSFVHNMKGLRQRVDLRKADAYSAGASIYEVLTGQLPLPLHDSAEYDDITNYFLRQAGNNKHAQKLSAVNQTQTRNLILCAFRLG